MEISSIQNTNYIKKEKINNSKVLSVPNFCAEKKELPNIKSDNYVLNVKVPQKYSHINTFEIPQVGKAHFYKLQSGQRVVIVPTDGEVVVKTHVNVGSMNEREDIRGISHYIEHNLFNGTQNLSEGEFFKQTNQLGAKTNASTSFAKTDYYIATQLLEQKDLEKIINLHADMIENPAFKLEQLEKEKGPVISEIAMVLDNDDNLVLNKSLKNLFQIKSKSPDIIAGSQQNIQNITKEDVLNYYNTWYTPDNMVTVITGDVKPEEVIKLVSKSFNKKDVVNAKNTYFEDLTPINKPVREDFISKKSNSAKIVLSTVGPKNNDIKERIKTEALLMYLTGYKSAVLSKYLKNDGSQVMTNIEKVSNLPSQNSAVMIAVNTNEENVEKNIKKIYWVLDNVSKHAPTKDNMEAIKNNMLKNYSLMMNNSAMLNNMVGESFLNCEYNSLSNIKDMINSLTSHDIQMAASKYMDLNKMSIAVSHAKNSNEGQIKNNYNKVNKPVSFGNREVVNSNEVKQVLLPNNMTLLLNKSKSDLAFAQIEFNTKVPCEVNPMAKFILSKMLNSGYAGVPERIYNNNLDKKAIDLKFDVSENGFWVNMSANEKDFDFALNNFAKVMNNPRISEKEFINAKRKLKQILKTTTSTSQDYALKEIFGSKYKNFGVQEDFMKMVDEVEFKDVKILYNYILNNSYAVASMNVKNPEEINQQSSMVKNLSSITNNFKDVQYGKLKTFEPIEEEKTIFTEREQKQADIVRVYTYENSDNIKDKVAIELLDLILGGSPSSRLFKDLREEQKLAYRVYTAHSSFGNTGMFKLGILTTTDDGNKKSFDNVEKSLDGFEKHVEILKNEKISDEELNGVKKFLKARILELNNSQSGKNMAILNSFSKHEGMEYYNKYLKTIDEISVDDILNTANYIFENKPVTSIIASKKTIENYKD